MKFSDFISQHLNTRKWVVARWLYPSLAARGYTVAVSQNKYNEIHALWEAEYPDFYKDLAL